MRRHALLPLLFACLGLSAVAESGSAEATLELALPASATRGTTLDALQQARARLAELGIDTQRCGTDLAHGTLVVDLVDDAEKKAVLAAGFQVVRSFDAKPLAQSRTQSQYLDPANVDSALAQIHSDHPSITRRFVVGTTFEGREIHGIEISNQPGVDEDEPALLWNGQHHSREVATSHVAMDVVERLTDGYGSDATLTRWVNDYKTVVVPMVNPDGTQYVFSFNSNWRKNRRAYEGSCVGVDLNRNYPYRWGPAGCTTPSSCASFTYPGPSASSEAETLGMIDLAEYWNFTLATSYHSFGRFIDYPYACSTGNPADRVPEHDVIDEIMNGMADAIDAVDAVPRYDVYSPTALGPLNGDDTSWYFAAQGTYAMVVEVGTAFEPAFSQVAGIVSRNRGGWRYLYERLDAARIDVHTTDALTSNPIEAIVTLTQSSYDTGESPRVTSLPFGRWTYLVPANASYSVRVSAPGYAQQEFEVSVGSTPATLDVALSPDAAPIPTGPRWLTWLLAATLLAVASLRRRSTWGTPPATHDR